MVLSAEQQKVVDGYINGLRGFKLANATGYSEPGAYHILNKAMDEARLSLVTPYTRLKENLYDRVGVFVVLISDQGEVLLCQEKGDDIATGKKTEQWGLIGEKAKEGERMKHTVIGGLVEELGESVLPNLSAVQGNTYLGEMRVPWTKACARIFALKYRGDKKIILPHQSEIKDTCWIGIDDALVMDGNLRPGTKEILERVQPAIPNIVNGQSLRLNHHDLSRIKERSSKPDIKW